MATPRHLVCSFVLDFLLPTSLLGTLSYTIALAVALNSAQYGDSEMCGACIEGEGSGNGSGSDPITGSFKVRHEKVHRNMMRFRRLSLFLRPRKMMQGNADLPICRSE